MKTALMTLVMILAANISQAEQRSIGAREMVKNSEASLNLQSFNIPTTEGLIQVTFASSSARIRGNKLQNSQLFANSQSANTLSASIGSTGWQPEDSSISLEKKNAIVALTTQINEFGCTEETLGRVLPEIAKAGITKLNLTDASEETQECIFSTAK
jgi:hypothetical protein